MAKINPLAKYTQGNSSIGNFSNMDLFLNQLRRKNTNNNVSSLRHPVLQRQETIGNTNVENLEVINIDALEKEVKSKGVGNRGSPTFSLTESLENLPVKPKWKYNPLRMLKTKKRGGKRRQTRKYRRYGKK